MLKSSYKMFNYIRKKERITETALSKKFPDFMDLLSGNSCYYSKEDKNEEYRSKIEQSICSKADEMNLSNSEAEKYISTHMPEIQSSTDYIFYSVSDKFIELREQKHEKLLLFWLPYSITTAIAIASLIAQFLT